MVRRFGMLGDSLEGATLTEAAKKWTADNDIGRLGEPLLCRPK